MAKLVSLTIDDVQVEVPAGTLIVDAAKKAGIDIPVFCYHPKMEPVGMCRMCLVEIGRPAIDRATGELVKEEDGSIKINFGPKLETACTTPVSEGMVVHGKTENVKLGREDILEFLLTSHPLDCPICDKGGECPLQNLTMGFGPGESRFIYDEKMHLAKHVPLGELIYLDRERCIQCGRCVRFQDVIADDPVIGFYQRGRKLEIITNSEPGFDSYFSGNTTDICPVGALTTADFRFQARPWELNAAASLCTQCPVGCNTTLNVRREAKSGGKFVVKRVMPRQNESVNEIWVCDKGRLGYHFSESPERLEQPLVRKNGELVPVSWDEALDLVAARLNDAGENLLTLVSGRLSNEDLFNLKQLSDKLGGSAALYTQMAGGDLTSQVGFAPGTNFSDMDHKTAILVVASDLREEAPIWWLRVKQAAQRGAKLIVANPRPTRLDKWASHLIRYPYGSEAATVLAMLNTLSPKRPELHEAGKQLVRSPEVQAAARVFAEVENAVVIFGSEGTSLAASQALAEACSNLLIATNHVGRPNNGLLGVWGRANDQGAWDMGFRPQMDLRTALQSARILYVIAADPAGDDPALVEAMQSDFVVVQELFLTSTAKLADVVLPVQSYTEREGSLTSGERRVQRYYPAVPERPGSLADFAVTAQIAQRLGLALESKVASKVMIHLAAEVPAYAGLTYIQLAQVEEQWPLVGRGDVYYGGTTYENKQGLGVQLQLTGQAALSWPKLPEAVNVEAGLLAVPVTRLYDRGQTLLPSKLLHQRILDPYVVLNRQDAISMKIETSQKVQAIFDDGPVLVDLVLDEDIPAGIVLVPRSLGIPINGPAAVKIRAAERLAA